MAEITAAAVKAFRERTGLPLMDCKKALQEAGGDEDQAVEVLRKRGQQLADKRKGLDKKLGRAIARAAGEVVKGKLDVGEERLHAALLVTRFGAPMTHLHVDVVVQVAAIGGNPFMMAMKSSFVPDQESVPQQDVEAVWSSRRPAHDLATRPVCDPLPVSHRGGRGPWRIPDHLVKRNL